MPQKLVFISTFDYPTRYAHALHGLSMARAFHQQFSNSFLFFINTDVLGVTKDIPHRKLFGSFGRSVKKLHLRRALIIFPVLYFFYTSTKLRNKETAVFINDPQLIFLGGLLVRCFGVRFVYESHGTLSPHQEKVLATYADRVVFVTPFLEAEAKRNTPSLVGRTRTIPNAVDTSLFDAVTEESCDLRARLALPEAFTIGYIGRFEPLGVDKGIALMLSALHQLPGVRLLLVGGAKNEVEEYTNKTKELGVSKQVTIVPFVDPSLVPRYAKACDVLAYVPSGGNAFFEKETSPMKVYEYMAARRSMVLTDLPTTRTIVSNDAAYLIPSGSLDAFVDAIRAIRKDPADASGKASRAYALAHDHSWLQRVEDIFS